MTELTPRGLPIAELSLAIVLIVLLVAGFFGFEHILYLLETLDGLVAMHYWLALSVFVISFALLALLAMPIGSLYCLAAGYFFGIGMGAAAALLGAVLGANLTFILVRRFGGRNIRTRLESSRFKPWLVLLERDASWFLILSRIVPVAPFFAINAAAGMTRIGSWHFCWATMIGLVPTTLIYAAIGNGLGSMLEARELIGFRILFNPVVALPLLGLIILLVVGWLLRSRLLTRVQ